MIDLETELKGTYEIISGPADQPPNLVIRLKPQVSWSYFHGHFPAQPILPAVGIADISQYFVENYFFKSKRSLKKVSQFRIRTPVQPDQQMLLAIEKDNENQFHVTWKNETENSNSAEINLEWS